MSESRNISSDHSGPEMAKPAPVTGLPHLVRATRYTCAGLRTALQESAFRQELAMGVGVLILAPWLFGFVTGSIAICAWLFLLVTELLNTGIESIVDLVSPEYHNLAKRAKDLGSAAVGISIVLNILTWAVLLYVRFLVTK